MISNTKKNIYVGTSSFKGHLGLTAKGKKYSLRKNETVELELTPEDFKKLNYPTKFLTFVIKNEDTEVKTEVKTEIKTEEVKIVEEVKVEEAKEEVVEIKETIEETKEPEVKETKKPVRKSRKKAVKIETEENE